MHSGKGIRQNDQEDNPGTEEYWHGCEHADEEAGRKEIILPDYNSPYAPEGAAQQEPIDGRS